MPRGPEPSVPPSGPQPVETALTVARIASYDASTARLRDVAKWFATSTVALTAFLAAAFPVAGIVSERGAVTWTALAWGAGALVALGTVVALASRVLAPRVVTVEAIATQLEFTGLRDEVAREPTTFLGLWASDVPGLVERRRRAVADQRNVMAQLADPALAPDLRTAFQDRRRVVERDLTILGWVSYRLEGAGLYAVTWRRFTTLRVWSAVAAAIAAICLVGLVVSSHDDSAERYRGAAVTLAFLEDLAPAPTQLLGATCPDVVTGELVSSGAEPPWTVRITQEGCDAATLHVGPDQAVLVIHDG